MKWEMPAFESVSSRDPARDPVPDRGRADVREPLRDHALARVERRLHPRLHGVIVRIFGAGAEAASAAEGLQGAGCAGVGACEASGAERASSCG